MTTIQYTESNFTKWMRWFARGAGLLAALIALLVIGGMASEWLLKGSLEICRPALEGPRQWSLCQMLVSAMGGWADEIAAAPWPVRETILAGLLSIAIVGVLIAWFWEGLGGALLVGSALLVGLFAYLTSAPDKDWQILWLGGPFLILGLIFLVCWRTDEKNAIQKDQNDDDES